MAKTERFAQQLHEMEREYQKVLRRALTNCASGRWGLFGHNEHLRASGAPPELGELRELAEGINRIRARFGEVSYPLHEELEAARGRAGPNAPGEPRQARAWLERLSGV